MTISTAQRIAATPAARRRAAELHVVLGDVIAAGHGVRVSDVNRHAQGADDAFPLESAQLTQVVEVDVTGIVDVLPAVARAAVVALRVSPMVERAVSVTDLGGHGAVFCIPMLTRGQAGLLGVGAVVRRPVVVLLDDGREAFGIRSMAHLILAYDHRLVDGSDAGRFLTVVKNSLQTEERTRA